MSENLKSSIIVLIKKLRGYIDKFREYVLHYNEKNYVLYLVMSKKTCNKMKEISANLGKNEVLIERDIIQCTLLGKTSNGKSAVINAMLGEKVLPSAKGRTTSCFISVEGCDTDTGYVLDFDEQRHELSWLNDSVNEMKSMVKENKDSGNDIINDGRKGNLVKVFYPKSKCPLLRHNIQLMDIPGVDTSAIIDEDIETYCLNADMFAYVIDSETTISDVEREFFTKYKSKVATPKIFVLLNKWDRCLIDSSEDELEELINQHSITVQEFLLSFQREPQNVLYFISATDMLMKEKKGTFKQTRGDFEKFMKDLEEYTVKMAKNKLFVHFHKIKEYLNELSTQIGDIQKCHEREHSLFGKDNLNKWIESMHREWKIFVIINLNLMCARLVLQKKHTDKDRLQEINNTVNTDEIFKYLKEGNKKIRKSLSDYLSDINTDLSKQYMPELYDDDQISSIMITSSCVLAVQDIIEEYLSPDSAPQTSEQKLSNQVDKRMEYAIGRYVDYSEHYIKQVIDQGFREYSEHLKEADDIVMTGLTEIKGDCELDIKEIQAHLVEIGVQQ